jgi:predicted RNA binding protein YcfA (HicA-like mRNA interferase family)
MNLYKAVAKVLTQYGCYEKRKGKGSHEIWHSPRSQRTFPVPVTLKSRHTANKIMEQAGLPKQF